MAVEMMAVEMMAVGLNNPRSRHVGLQCIEDGYTRPT
jgi:hypothetical protein